MIILRKMLGNINLRTWSDYKLSNYENFYMASYLFLTFLKHILGTLIWRNIYQTIFQILLQRWEKSGENHLVFPLSAL